ncbi:MAG: hypothetical protein ACXWYM_00360 [Candidatus Binatia bacterium]
MLTNTNKPSADQLCAKTGSEAVNVDMQVASLPEGCIETLFLNYCIVSQAKPADKIGSIHVPESAKAATEYAAQIGRIEAVGQYFYNHGVYKSIPEADRPKVGDYVFFRPYVARRIEPEGVVMLVLKDDDLIGKINPAKKFNLFT